MNIVILTFVLSIFFVVIGMAAGKSGIATECLQTGAFHAKGVTFTCKPQGAAR